MDRSLFELHAAIEDRHWWFRGRRRILLELGRKLSPPRPGSLVLDIGCGTGGNLAAFEEYRRVGVDESEDAVRLARRRFPAIRFVHGRAPADVPHALAEADLVLLTDVLEHIEDDRAALAGITAGMRPGTNLLITVPADMRLWSPHDVSFGHYRRYSSASLAVLWEGLPLRTCLLSPFNSRLWPAVRAVRAIGARTNRASGSAGTDFRVPPKPLNWMLERIFAGEAGALKNAVDGDGPPFRRGVSLIAALSRTG